MYVWHVERDEVALALDELEYKYDQAEVVLTAEGSYYDGEKACQDIGGRLFVPSSEADLVALAPRIRMDVAVWVGAHKVDS